MLRTIATTTIVVLIFSFGELRGQPQLESFEQLVDRNTCRVRVKESERVTAHGTGVLLHGQVPWVLTASHVVPRTGSRVYCDFSGKTYLGTVVVRRPDEGAVIRLDLRPQRPLLLEGLPISSVPTQPGEKVWALGYGGPSDQPRWESGRVLSTKFTNGSKEFPGHWRLGDSGGPVIAYRQGVPQVLGVAWGRNDRERNVVFTGLRVTRAMFNLKTRGDESGPPIQKNTILNPYPVQPAVGQPPQSGQPVLRAGSS